MRLRYAIYPDPKTFHLQERSLWSNAAWRFARNKLSVIALLLARALIALAILAPTCCPRRV
ncbi:MAG: hypothetical protein R2867_11580 [Caldilineaceae bacterium]